MIQKLPKGWTMMKIIDIAENISAGGTPSRDKKEYWNQGKINWLKISDMKSTYISQTEEKITKIGLEKSSCKLFQKGTLVYSIFATLGAIGILNINSATNQAIVGIVPKKDIINTKYLYYCLHAEKNRILVKKTHSTQYNLNLSIIKNHEIPVAPLRTQQKIISILEKAEKLNEMRKEADELTKDYLKAIFMKMFGDPSTNPKNLKVKKIEEICNVKTGGTPDRSEVTYWNNGDIPWVKTAEINENTIEKTEELITKEGSKNSNASIYPKNSILIAMYGQGKTRGRVAKLGIDASTNQACAILLPSKNYNTDYLLNLLKLSYKNLRNLGRGGNQPNLNLTLIKQFNVILPHIHLQEKFMSIVKQVDELKIIQGQLKKHLDKFQDNLIQKAFKGELTC